MDRRLFLFASVTGLAAAGGAHACIWDRDTLAMERERFPTTLELITGKFLRRSRELYLWRIANRTERLKSEPENLALSDDLAVAYDKTGQHDKAIALAKSMRDKKPGRYETEANLGTFYIHAGNREQGLAHIRVAIKINPDAHFGREKYQALLAEYVLLRLQENAGKLPLPLAVDSRELYNADGKPKTPHANFHDFIASGVEQRKRPAHIAAAIKGVLGMMKFGDFESPVLLEVLGDLLLQGGTYNTDGNAAQLAARAFLKASYHVKDSAAQAAYRERMQKALSATENIPPELLESQFKRELDEARAWFSAVEANEKQWIAEGLDPDAAFERMYYQQPAITTQHAPVIQTRGGMSQLESDVLWAAAGAALLAAAGGGVWWCKRRRVTRQPPV